MSIRAAFIALAAGSGQRFEGPDNKVYSDLGGRTLLGYSLEAAAGTPLITRVVVVARADDIALAEAVAAGSLGGVPYVVTGGGDTRQDSELAGLEALAEPIDSGEVEIVAIHDGARPFLTSPLLSDVVEAAHAAGGAVPGLVPTDAIWTTAGSTAPGPLDKAGLRAVQTPQAFDAGALLTAYRAAAADGFSGADTAATVARYSDLAIRFVPGDPRNTKVTFADDLEHALLEAGRWSAAGWLSEPRPGTARLR